MSELELQLPWKELEEILGSDCLNICKPQLQQMACNWVCNAITTGAHVLVGKVYHNLMVDIKVR